MNLNELTPEQKREELIKRLKSHDWYYDRSDDPYVYRNGREERQTIQWLVKQVLDGQDLYNTYAAPRGF